MKYEASKRKNILVVLIVVILVLCIGLFMKNRMNILNNSFVNEESIVEELDENLIGAYIQQGEEYVKADTIPTSGYEFNEEKSYCKIGDIIQGDITLFYDMDTQTITVSPITKKGLKCYLYFDEKASGSETILAQEGGVDVILAKGTPNFNNIATADEGMYAAEDDYGTSFYFRGAVQDNWLQFGGFYWRIIRINGNGTIRIIYNGTSTSQTGIETQINETRYTFNNTDDNNMYVGYMYQSGQVHGLQTSSNSKIQLDNWYSNNLHTNYGLYVDGSTGFCGDRTPSTELNSSNGSGGTGITTTYYGGLIRLTRSVKSPILQCNNNDLYTTSDSNDAYPNPSGNGNQALVYPIGLITADEVAMAGGVYTVNNNNYYLYTGQPYWTMSPYHFNRYNDTLIFGVNPNGFPVNFHIITSKSGLRPVINLRSDVQITGSGTVSDPFKVIGAS